MLFRITPYITPIDEHFLRKVFVVRVSGVKEGLMSAAIMVRHNYQVAFRGTLSSLWLIETCQSQCDEYPQCNNNRSASDIGLAFLTLYMCVS